MIWCTGVKAKYRSGGPIENLGNGWALIWPAKKVHYWWIQFYDQNYPENMQHVEQTTWYWRSICGMVKRGKNDARPPLEGGNWPRCKHCLERRKGAIW